MQTRKIQCEMCGKIKMANVTDSVKKGSFVMGVCECGECDCLYCIE